MSLDNLTLWVYTYILQVHRTSRENAKKELEAADSFREMEEVKFHYLITSCVSGQGNRIGSVCVCNSACLNPSQLRDFWAKGLQIRETWEVRENSGVFILTASTARLSGDRNRGVRKGLVKWGEFKVGFQTQGSSRMNVRIHRGLKSEVIFHYIKIDGPGLTKSKCRSITDVHVLYCRMH